MQDVFRRLTDARLASYSPVVLGWQPYERIRERLERETAEAIDRTGDEQFGAMLMSRFPRQGTIAADYQDSILHLPDGSPALTGIRWRGGDPGRPFVEVMVHEGGVTADRLGTLSLAIGERWSSFHPFSVRLFAPDADSVPPGACVDRRIVAGRVADLRYVGPVPGLAVERASHMSWYEDYRREYEEFRSAVPERAEWTWPETAETLTEAQGRGEVYLIRLRGRLAGVYAMPRACAHGLQGFRVQEKFLFAWARGRGLGTAAERAVAGRLPAGPDDVVFGSIDDRNAAALRSAYRLGRVDIGAWVWVTPFGRP